MNSNPWREWPVQMPSEGFADRTVAAILAADAPRPKKRARRTWVLLVAAAVVVLQVSAWAMLANRKPHAVVPAPAASQPAAIGDGHQPPPSFQEANVAAPPVSASAANSAPVRVAPVPRHSASSLPVDPEPDVQKPLRVPRCNCVEGQWMCTCIE